MMMLKVRIKKVDPYGFTGRDNHPEVSDEGHEALVTNIDFVPDQEMESPSMTYNGVSWWGYQVFHAVTDTGRHVELMGHEIEFVSCEHDKDL